MRIAIIGSRDYKHLEKIDSILDMLKRKHTDVEGGINLELISGGAIGVDKRAEAWNNKLPYSLPFKVIRPVDPKNRMHYLYRNIEIITLADEIYAFWNGESPGTRFTIDYANSRGKRIFIVGDEK